jgi:hypothetical protein
VRGRRGRRRKQLLDGLKEKRGYCKLKKEALDRTLWRTRFGRVYGPDVRQTAEWMNYVSALRSRHVREIYDYNTLITFQQENFLWNIPHNFNFVENVHMKWANRSRHIFDNVLSFFSLVLTSFYLLMAGIDGYCCIWSHSATHTHSGGLLWKRDRPVADKTHNTHKRQTPMPRVWFEPAISACERPQTHVIDCAATRIGYVRTSEKKINRGLDGSTQKQGLLCAIKLKPLIYVNT